MGKSLYVICCLLPKAYYLLPHACKESPGMCRIYGLNAVLYNRFDGVLL